MEHTPPPFFRRGPTPLIRLLACSLVSLALLIADSRFGYLEGVRSAVAVVTYPLQRFPSLALVAFGRVGSFFVSQAALQTENSKLIAENLQNAGALQKYQALDAENAHLRQLLGVRKRLPEGTVVAEVLYSGRDPFARKLIIDKGTQHGIKAGYPVIDQAGLLGQTTRPYPWLSEITLITDKSQVVPVQNVRNGLRALLGGTGNDDELELKFIPLNADFTNGDQLVTSGIDGVYPPGVPVAVVSKVGRDASYAFARITCKPVAGVATHRQVLVVTWTFDAPVRPAPPEPRVKTQKPRKAN